MNEQKLKTNYECNINKKANLNFPNLISAVSRGNIILLKMRCAVASCNTDNQAKHYDKSFKLFRFPKNVRIRDIWFKACGRKDKFNINNARICSKHFDENDYERNLQYELMGYSSKTRRAQLGKRKRKKIVDDIFESSSACGSGVEIIGEPLEESLGTFVLAKVTENIDVMDEPQEENVGRFVLAKAIEKVDVINEPPEADMSPTNKSSGVKTEYIPPEDQMLIISQLREEIRILKEEKKAFENLFTAQQIKKLREPEKRPRWTVEDISKAIVIHSAGPRAYRLLLKKGFPFPAVSTLRAWCKKIQIRPGILTQVFETVQRANLTEIQKLCVLSFDEMKIRKIYLYDKVTDETLKPYNYVQVVMLRGLVGNWKQPIYFNYDCSMTKDLLFRIITFVENSGFPVVAMVSDMGGGNRHLHNELTINVEQTWFLNPTNDNKIHVFADVPHLMKLLRNHFVDHGFILNGVELNKTIIEKLINLTASSDLNIAHKISFESLNVVGPKRQKVKLATKLFSHTISKAITRCGTLGKYEDNNWIHCAEFFKLVNDWFDCFNVRVPKVDSRERMHVFGLSIETQTNIVNNMTKAITNLRVKGRKKLLPFQSAILISNNTLKLLYSDLKERYNINYILTYRLNQDVLENFFAVIRSKGGLHDHPDALEFKYRLRAYILGRNEGSLSDGGNVDEDTTPDLLHHSEIQGELLSGQCFSLLRVEDAEEADESDILNTELDSLTYDGLENLAGFICHKLKKIEPSVSTPSSSDQRNYTWIDHLSEGGLSKPPEELMVNLEKLEHIFKTFNSEEIFIGKNYIDPECFLESRN